jgi:glycosyltransferase involved in cell wall biosynthesis
MDILFFMNHYPDSRNGGIENVTRMLSERLVLSGHTVDVVYLLPSDFDHSDDSIFRRVERTSKETFKKDLNNWIASENIDVIINRCVIFASPYIKQIIKDKNCKLITTYNNKPTLSSQTIQMIWRDKGLSLFNKIVISAFYPLYSYRSKIRLKQKHQASYASSDMTVLLSYRYIPEYTTLMNVPDKKLAVVNNPIRDDLKISQEDLQNKKKIVLMVTRLDETQKCIIKALKVWQIVASQYPDWNLKIVGNGPDEKMIKEYAATNQIRKVSFIKACNPEPYYKEAAIFLMTSRNEGWPNTINEAMRMGCVPVVVASFSAVFDMIDTWENGILIGDSHSEFEIRNCAHAILSLIESKERWMDMLTKAIMKTERLSLSYIANMWVNLIESYL